MRAMFLFVLALALGFGTAFAKIEDRAKSKHDDALKLAKQATAKMNEKAWDEAIALYTEALDMNALEKKGAAQARYNRGIAYSNTNQCDKAIADFDAAVEVLTEESGIYMSRAVCKIKTQQTEQGLADLNKAVELKPDEPQYRRLRCLANYNLRKIAEALPDCDLALAAKPDDVVVLEAVGTGAETLGDFARARAAYTKLAEVQPGNKVAQDGLKRIQGK